MASDSNNSTDSATLVQALQQQQQQQGRARDTTEVADSSPSEHTAKKRILRKWGRPDEQSTDGLTSQDRLYEFLLNNNGSELKLLHDMNKGGRSKKDTKTNLGLRCLRYFQNRGVHTRSLDDIRMRIDATYKNYIEAYAESNNAQAKQKRTAREFEAYLNSICPRYREFERHIGEPCAKGKRITNKPSTASTSAQPATSSVGTLTRQPVLVPATSTSTAVQAASPYIILPQGSQTVMGSSNGVISMASSAQGRMLPLAPMPQQQEQTGASTTSNMPAQSAVASTSTDTSAEGFLKKFAEAVGSAAVGSSNPSSCKEQQQHLKAKGVLEIQARRLEYLRAGIPLDNATAMMKQELEEFLKHFDE